MMDYNWPGNIRELEHLIERSVLLAKGTMIEDLHLPLFHKKEILSKISYLMNTINHFYNISHSNGILPCIKRSSIFYITFISHFLQVREKHARAAAYIEDAGIARDAHTRKSLKRKIVVGID